MASDDVLPSIPIDSLREGEINTHVLPNGKKAILIRRGSEVRVFSEVCPHLGADLAEGRYCAKTNKLHCKWHGYVFGTDDGAFLENPNEKFMRLIRIPSEHFKPEKTPRYRLHMLKSSVQNGRVTIGEARREPARNAEPSNETQTTERAEP